MGQTKLLCIQLQPELLNGVALEDAKRAIQTLANSPAIISFHTNTGNDKGIYVDFIFETNELSAFWKFAKESIYQPSGIGGSIASASIVTCEGEHGWNDYLLLHHFDSSQTCNTLLDDGDINNQTQQ